MLFNDDKHVHDWVYMVTKLHLIISLEYTPTYQKKVYSKQCAVLYWRHPHVCCVPCAP